MSTSTPGVPGLLDSAVLGTVHMHIKTGVSTDIIDLVVTSFTEEEILGAKTELIEFIGMVMVVPGGHKDTAERSAAYLYAKELVVLVHELDKDNRMPKVVVSSDQLNRIPLGKKGLSPAEAVPISTRMNDLEDTVQKLCQSFEKFKNENQAPKVCDRTFADIATGNLGAVQRSRANQGKNGGPRQGVVPPIQVTGPPPGTWAAEMAGQAGQGYYQGGHLGRGLHQGGGQQGGRSVSPKRPRQDSEDAGVDGQQGGKFQTVPPRKPRKVTYGKSKVTMEGAEAAPVEIFIGNTNPKATPEIIATVMKKCALDLPEKIELEVLEVKCLNNVDLDPNPRTRCWKIVVPYRFKELMARDDLYYCGWSHRQFYPPRQNKAKRHQPDPNDPVAEHLSGAGASGGQPCMEGA